MHMVKPERYGGGKNMELINFLMTPFVYRALLAVLFIAINAALTGAFASFRDSTFLITGSSHSALAGASFIILMNAWGYLNGVDPLVGALITGLALSLVAGHVSNRSSDRAVNNAIGVGFAFSMGIALLIISLIPESASRVWGLLMGDLLLTTTQDLVFLGILTVVVLFLFLLSYREFIFVSFDLEGARAMGIHAELYNYLLFFLIGVSTVIILKGVGAILVFAMLAGPGATAMLISQRVEEVILFSFIIAFFSGVGAIMLSYYVDFSAGAVAAVFASGSYFVVYGAMEISDMGRKK